MAPALVIDLGEQRLRRQLRADGSRPAASKDPGSSPVLDHALRAVASCPEDVGFDEKVAAFRRAYASAKRVVRDLAIESPRPRRENR